MADALLFASNVTILNPASLFIDAPVIARFPSVIPAADALAYPTPSTEKASNGFFSSDLVCPDAVIEVGLTAAAVAEIAD